MARTYNFKVGKRYFDLYCGNISDYEAEGLVCPANGELTRDTRSMVQNAIAEKAGEKIFEESARKAAWFFLRNPPSNLSLHYDASHYFVYPNSAHTTSAGKFPLPVKRIIYSVCSIDKEIMEVTASKKETVEVATLQALNAGLDDGLESICFPLLGTELCVRPPKKGNPHRNTFVESDIIGAMANVFAYRLNQTILPKKIALAIVDLDVNLALDTLKKDSRFRYLG